MPNFLQSGLTKNESENYAQSFLGGVNIGAAAARQSMEEDAAITKQFIVGEYNKRVQKMQDDAAMQRKQLEEQEAMRRQVYTTTVTNALKALGDSEDILKTQTQPNNNDSTTIQKANSALSGIQASREHLTSLLATGDSTAIAQAAASPYTPFAAQPNPADVAKQRADEVTARMTELSGGVKPDTIFSVTGHLPEAATDESGNITGIKTYMPTSERTNLNTVQGAMDRKLLGGASGGFIGKAKSQLSGVLSNYDRMADETTAAQKDVTDYYNQKMQENPALYALTATQDPVLAQKNRYLSTIQGRNETAQKDAAIAWSQVLSGIQSDKQAPGKTAVLEEAQTKIPNMPIGDIAVRPQLRDVLYTMYDDAAKKYSAANNVSAKVRLADIQNVIGDLGYSMPGAKPTQAPGTSLFLPPVKTGSYSIGGQ